MSPEEQKAVFEKAGLELIHKGAGHHIGRFFDRKQIKLRQAAIIMGISSTTLSRLVNGGSLTVPMATKISIHYNLPIHALFNLQARYMTKKTMAIVND
jgi:plasmid maintenance system antidote protein VapI